MKGALVLALLVPALAVAAPAPSTPDRATEERAREAVVAALTRGGDIPGQARGLVALAWPSGKRDEPVAAAARHELEGFGDHAFEALQEAMNSVKTPYTAEVVTTLLGAQKNARVEMAGGYMSALLDTLWVGSREAKTIALNAFAFGHSPLAVQPMIDSALDDPALTPLVIEVLGKMRYPQARFYLEKIMMEGPPNLRSSAASSLSQIGGAALAPLRNALKAPARETRLLAARAILPAATEYDLGAIYEYVEKYGDDDPALSQALKASATNIEKAIAARDASAAAASPKDF